MTITDAILQRDVMAALDAPAIGIAVHLGTVTISGLVSSWSEKHAIEQSVLAVPGVRDVANEIEIRMPWDAKRSDTELASAVRCALADERIQCVVDDGAATLSGLVETEAQREAAAGAARQVPGVRCVENDLATHRR